MDDLERKARIFGLIFTLSNRLQVLGDKFDKNLTVKQWLLLASIFKSGEDAPAISKVADIIGSSRQNVKKMALILEREGFLNLKKDPNDARILRVSPTRKCQDYLKQREKGELNFLRQLFDGFDSDLIRGLDEGISKLETNINEMEKYYGKEDKE